MDFIFPVLFYSITLYLYLYSKGRTKKNKSEAFQKWVDNKGNPTARRILILIIIYSVILAYNIIISL